MEPVELRAELEKLHSASYGWALSCCSRQREEAEDVLQTAYLKILEDAGLVGREKDGLWVNYSLTDGGRSPYAASLLGNLRHWLADDPEILDLLEKSDDVRREDICGKHG